MSGPTPAFDPQDYAALFKQPHLKGYAAKIRQDLLRIARVYNGIKVRVFTLDETGTPCPSCVDAFTGQVVDSACPACNGTGYQAGYTEHEVTYAIAQLSPKHKTSTQMGDSEGQGRRDVFILIDAPLLQDQDFIATVDTSRIYKIVDAEPTLTAIGGDVVMQTITCAPLSKGAPEYKALAP